MRVAVVVVTYNRSHLLTGCLDGLAAQTRPADLVLVVDNASTDDTRAVLEARTDLPLEAMHLEDNTGGAGGFHTGVARAYARGFDAVWLMDDDVVAHPDCLERLLEQGGPAACVVREGPDGSLVEKAALRFDLANPLAIKPKTAAVDTEYSSRSEMPPTVEVENVAFEGFLVRREVIDATGLPDPTYFIFYDDCDWAIRIRRAGFTILAVRDAAMTRQLPFDQQHDLAGWKGYYMYRNLFAVHLRYAENPLVRAKPWLIALAVCVLSPLRGGSAERRNVLRALRDARGMRHLAAVAGPGGAASSLDSSGDL